MESELEPDVAIAHVIHIRGEAHFDKNSYCLWHTADGSQLTCTIQNQSDLNTLTVAITGAPGTVQTAAGELFNGAHALPPNNPASLITIADFEGTVVTIANISADQARCFVQAV